MQPLLHFGPPGPGKCNPCCTLAPRGPENATPMHFGLPGPRNCKPLLHFGPPGPGKCNPYCILAPKGLENATPIAFWAPGSWKMQPLLHFGPPPGGRKKRFFFNGFEKKVFFKLKKCFFLTPTRSPAGELERAPQDARGVRGVWEEGAGWGLKKNIFLV